MNIYVLNNVFYEQCLMMGPKDRNM